MRAKTSELTGKALDWAVAIARGLKPEDIYIACHGLCRRLRDDNGELDGSYMTGPDLLFSRKWEAGGPIIEREEIGTKRNAPCTKGREWEAMGSITARGAGYGWAYGPTPLIAAMRCYVASKLGDEVDVPDELLTP